MHLDNLHTSPRTYLPLLETSIVKVEYFLFVYFIDS